ncbi:MAG: hypothetical protein KBD19_04615 [Candidatus Moranbacteria bacterium]|nr:hypothetical protein [Candidatus Moranbacteria bacterium]
MALLALATAISSFVGCDQQLRQIAPNPVERPGSDVSAILVNATELREEKLFLITLGFEKEQITLDFWKHAKNAMTAEYRTLIVDEKAFNEYQIGRNISNKVDDWGLIFNGEIAEYIVRPVEKKVESQYFWTDRNGGQIEISKEQYDEGVRKLHLSGRQLLVVPFAGVTRTYVLEKPLEEYQFVDYQSLHRYFVTIRVENTTFTPDLTKHIRNAANTHDITLEVPREAYEKAGDAWNAQLSTGSFVMKGRLSELHGKIIRKWSELDDSFRIAKTAGGQQFVIPK